MLVISITLSIVSKSSGRARTCYCEDDIPDLGVGLLVTEHCLFIAAFSIGTDDLCQEIPPLCLPPVLLNVLLVRLLAVRRNLRRCR